VTTPTSTPAPAVPDARHIPAPGGDLSVLPADAGWTYSGLRVLALEPGETRTLQTGEEEMVVLPLSGGCTVTCDGESHELAGRAGVFTRVTDFAYVPRDAEVTVTSAAGGRFALPSAVCERRLPFRYGAAEDVPVETRGSGSCTRQVNNFCAAGVFEADKLIAVEVLTPAGNWSSYPPHKHDQDRPGAESVLEEIYYFEVGDGPETPGVAYQRVYGTAEKPADLLAEVRTGDVVTIPHGWHGPSMAAPGYDLYYLNVMAGPSPERSWLICDDPTHGWVRETWDSQPVDPRVPMTGTLERAAEKGIQ
jgi:5-deoxy-glucuronate isomerase